MRLVWKGVLQRRPAESRKTMLVSMYYSSGIEFRYLITRIAFFGLSEAGEDGCAVFDPSQAGRGWQAIS
jgi:hypothetical protein